MRKLIFTICFCFILLVTPSYAAHTYTRSYAVVDLTVADSSQFVVDDYLTGGTSTAVGIVIEILDSTSIVVYEMSSTAFAPTETLTASDSGNSSSCTARVTYAGGAVPSDAVLVTGSDSSVTNIFRQIANVSGLGGVSNPSSTQNYLGLEMIIWFGRRGQSADTYAISEEEKVFIGNSGGQGSIRVIGNSSYSSTLRTGYAKYTDDDINNFPPAYTERGSVIEIDSSSFGDALYNDVYGIIENYRTQLKITSPIINGYWYCSDVWYKAITYGVIQDTANIYFYRFSDSGSGDAFVLLATVPKYWKDVKVVDASSGSSFLYAFSSSWETILEETDFMDTNGEFPAIRGVVTGGGFTRPMHFVHLINSKAQVTAHNTFFIGSTGINKNSTFKITVTDYDENPIEGAKVFLKDNNGGALYSKMTSTISAIYCQPVTVVDSTDVFTGRNFSETGATNGDKLRFTTTGTLPAPLSADTDYYIINHSGNTFKVSLTSGGSAVNITTTGSGTHRYFVKKATFSDTSEFSAGDKLRIEAQKVLVDSVTSGTVLELIPNQDGTISHDNRAVTGLVYKEDKYAETDANGVVEYLNDDNATGIPAAMSWQNYDNIYTTLTSTGFIMSIEKDGYETYKSPVEIDGENPVELQIKLRNLSTPGRDSMSPAFR